MLVNVRKRLVGAGLVATAAALLALATAAQAATTTAAQTVTITVPAKLLLTVNNSTVALTADPSLSDATNVTTSAAVVSVQSNYQTSQVLSVTSTTPNDGAGHNIAVGNLQFQRNGAIGNGAAPAATSNSESNGATWTGFSNASQNLVQWNGPVNGAGVTYDYKIVRNWAYPAGSYTCTVTYTLTGT